MRGRALGVAMTALLGCGDGEHFVVVTVQPRPAVNDATRLRVTLTNAGTMRTDELSLDGASFPVTFSLSAPGRAGALEIQVDAIDGNDLIVGRGLTSTSLDVGDASVLLDTTDFVVNTVVADDQYPSDDFESHGFQVAATTAGLWTVGFRDSCATPCNMFARRFDSRGRPATTQLAAGTNQFEMSSSLTNSLSTPAVAAAGDVTLQVWDFRHTVGGMTLPGIACRALDKDGRSAPGALEISTDPSTDVAVITPMSNNNFAVTWTGLVTTTVVRSAVVRPDCTVLPGGGPVTVSTTASPRRPAVAATGLPSTIMYAWIVAGSVYVRLASATNQLQGATDLQFLPATAAEDVEFVRVAPLGTGFAVVVRWVQATGFTGPGRIELYRTNGVGAVLGPPVPVTTRSGSDFQSSEGFSVATRADGMLMVVWHSCLENGDGQGCGVFGRAFRADGSPVGAEFSIPTTIAGDQANPSVTALADAFVVVWRDDSMQQPDVSGAAVRARIVYPEPATGTP